MEKGGRGSFLIGKILVHHELPSIVMGNEPPGTCKNACSHAITLRNVFLSGTALLKHVDEAFSSP